MLELLERQALVEPSRDSNTMDVDRGYKKCYNCGVFGHITQYYRNRKYIEEGRRISIDGHYGNYQSKQSIVYFSSLIE